MPKINLYVRLFIHIHFLERFQIDAFSANTLSLSRIEILPYLTRARPVMLFELCTLEMIFYDFSAITKDT